MMSANNVRIKRVVSSNGCAWQTSAQGAAEYLFNPVFMTYFTLCVVLYATLMQPSEETALPIPAQMILWGGLIMTSLVWLFFSVWASIEAHDRGLLKAIYTPLILLPMVLLNTIMGHFILSVFNETYQSSYGTMFESIVQNSIILITFDIMHAIFVAPQHPTYMSRRSDIVTEGAISEPAQPAVSSDTPNGPPAAATDAFPKRLTAQIPRSDADGPKLPEFITISNERIDISEILWVRSEDHYLSVHMTSRNLMLRGKLRVVVMELGDELGAQINRSAWVAFSAIRTLNEQDNGIFEVHLEDDTIHRIANSRRLFFKQNYERFKAAMDSGAKQIQSVPSSTSERTRNAAS